MGYSREYKDALDKLHEMMQELSKLRQSPERQALSQKIREQKKIVENLK